MRQFLKSQLKQITEIGSSSVWVLIDFNRHNGIIYFGEIFSISIREIYLSWMKNSIFHLAGRSSKFNHLYQVFVLSERKSHTYCMPCYQDYSTILRAWILGIEPSISRKDFNTSLDSKVDSYQFILPKIHLEIHLELQNPLQLIKIRISGINPLRDVFLFKKFSTWWMDVVNYDSWRCQHFPQFENN